MFRFLKQTLGWVRPKLRDPAAADRWTWLIIAAHTQLRLARDLTIDLRRPWERPCPAGRLTPTRVRRGFRHLRAKITIPASAPKPHRSGPGRPAGVPNQHRAPRHDVGKDGPEQRPSGAVWGRAGPLKAVGAAVNAPGGGDNEFALLVAVEGGSVWAGWSSHRSAGPGQAGASVQVPPLRIRPRVSSRRRFSAATRWCSHRSLSRAPTNRSRRLRPATSQEIERSTMGRCAR
jgi:hypothetical protein